MLASVEHGAFAACAASLALYLHGPRNEARRALAVDATESVFGAAAAAAAAAAENRNFVIKDALSCERVPREDRLSFSFFDPPFAYQKSLE